MGHNEMVTYFNIINHDKIREQKSLQQNSAVHPVEVVVSHPSVTVNEYTVQTLRARLQT